MFSRGPIIARYCGKLGERCTGVRQLNLIPESFMKAQNAYLRKLPRSASETAPSSPTALVLCVDDDITHLKLYGDLMTMNGYAVITCTNNRAALKAFRSKPVRLVVLDYSMPNMNGAQLARTMRGEKPNVPIVMLSGFADRPHDVDDAVSSYIVKGQNPRILLREIEELLWQQFAEASSRREAV
jgi:DNA-binding NtrC family response regulator